VRAGLELVAAVGALKTHAVLQTRVGIATGLVVVGDLIGSGVHRAALKSTRADGTALTNIFTGRPARSVVNRAMRELGLFPGGVPEFPLASADMRALMIKAESRGSPEFTALWSGQAATLWLLRSKPS
jgi:nitronate monooxygenase